MTRAFNFITVNNPNIAILSPSESVSTPFGQFLNPPYDEQNIFEESVARVQCQDMYLPNFSIRSSKGVFRHDAKLVNCNNEGLDLLGSCIFLQGTITSLLNHEPAGIDGLAGAQNFKYDPHNEYTHVVPADTDFHLLHFSYTYDYFSQFLPDNERWADSLKAKIENKERILGDRVVRLTACQQQALRNICNCPLEGKLGYLMIETSIVQLILIQLYEIFRVDNATTLTVANRRDKALMEDIKNYLSQSFLDDHSITSLSRQFGVNTNKLMTLFKAIFHQSIFEYIGSLRMQHARELILEQGMLVTEAARIIGYKNPNHFSAAFKKHFGVNPSAIRR